MCMYNNLSLEVIGSKNCKCHLLKSYKNSCEYFADVYFLHKSQRHIFIATAQNTAVHMIAIPSN